MHLLKKIWFYKQGLKARLATFITPIMTRVAGKLLVKLIKRKGYPWCPYSKNSKEQCLWMRGYTLQQLTIKIRGKKIVVKPELDKN